MAYDFSEAMTNMGTGLNVKRTAWTNGPNYITMFDPMTGSSASGKVIMQDTTGMHVTPWNPQNIDLVSDDWETVA